MRKFALFTLLALICLSLTMTQAQELSPSNVTVLVNRDGVNVRLFPAIGAEVLGFVSSGYTAQVYARSADNEWVRVEFSGEEGWIGTAVLTILAGDLNTVPVADPRTVPYGGFDSPRSGLTSATSAITGQLTEAGARLRAGPSRAYPMLANVPRNSVVPMLGRTRNNAWYQINYEGTLGWVTAQVFTLQGVVDIRQLPIDGIVADSLPFSQPTADDYFGTLRLLRDRINLAQPSLDTIRAVWTNVALGGNADCSNFPARPTGYNIPLPLLAAFVDQLNPLQTQFNDAMANIRIAIDLLIDICSRPQPTRGSVGQAVVQGALDAVNLADAQFVVLRQRINALLPPDRAPGANECLFQFGTQADILNLLGVNTIYLDRFDERRRIDGYCVDLAAGQTVSISVLSIDSSLSLFASFSPIDNPTAFAGTAQQAGGTTTVNLGPFTAPASARYLLIVTDRSIDATERDPATNGFYAVLVSAAGATIDSNNVVNISGSDAPAGVNYAALVPVSAGAGAGSGVIIPTINAPGGAATTAPGTFCPGLNLTCEQLTCDQARACYAAGNFTLDPDADTVPCENVCGGG